MSDDEDYARRNRQHKLLPAPFHARGNSADSTLTEGSHLVPMEPPPRPVRPKRPSPKKKNFASSSPAKLPAIKSRQVVLGGTEELHLTERDINSFLHPTLDELRKSIKQHNMKKGRVDVGGATYRAIVGYLGTIEMPKQKETTNTDSDGTSSSLLNIRNCIRRLRVEKKVHTTVLMCIFRERVTLMNHNGLKLADYPAEEIAFCGMCTDDKRFFGLVTARKTNKDEESEDDEVGESSSCHVFMTEAACDLEERDRRAKAFQFDNDEGIEHEHEFPDNADPIIRVVMDVFGERPSESKEPRKLDQLEEEEEMSIGASSSIPHPDKSAQWKHHPQNLTEV